MCDAPCRAIAVSSFGRRPGTAGQSRPSGAWFGGVPEQASFVLNDMYPRSLMCRQPFHMQFAILSGVCCRPQSPDELDMADTCQAGRKGGRYRANAAAKPTPCQTSFSRGGCVRGAERCAAAKFSDVFPQKGNTQTVIFGCKAIAPTLCTGIAQRCPAVLRKPNLTKSLKRRRPPSGGAIVRCGMFIGTTHDVGSRGARAVSLHSRPMRLRGTSPPAEDRRQSHAAAG